MVFAVILVFPSRFTANIKETAPSTIETVFMSFITRFKRGKVSCHSKNSCPSGYGCHILARNECRGAVMKYNNHFLRREPCLVASYGPVLQQENLFLFNNQHKLHVSLFFPSGLVSGAFFQQPENSYHRTDREKKRVFLRYYSSIVSGMRDKTFALAIFAFQEGTPER